MVFETQNLTADGAQQMHSDVISPFDLRPKWLRTSEHTGK